MSDPLAQFEEVKRQLAEELRNIDIEIAQKLGRKREIEAVLYGRSEALPALDSIAGKVLAFVQINPGVGRALIADGIEFDGDLKYLSNVLVTLRQQGRIRREGSKLNTVWFPVENEDSHRD